LYFALLKWTELFRGRPFDDSFGEANYGELDWDWWFNIGRISIESVEDPEITPEEWDEFYGKEWTEIFKVPSKRKTRFVFTVARGGHRFPRKYIWKKPHIAGRHLPPSHKQFFYLNRAYEKVAL
jgi:hypothetical protein